MHHRSPRNGAIWLFLGCGAFFAVANGMVFPMMSFSDPSEMLGLCFIAFWYAAFGAQMALHAVWCVFVPLHWIKRFLVGATSALVLYAVLAVAFACYFVHLGFMGTEDWLILVIGLFCLPLLLLAAQAPLWIMRIWFRWRIVHRDDGPSTPFQSLRIRDLMIATAVIAMALTAAQISQSFNGDGNIVGMTIAALVVLAISAITVLPTVLATLRSRRLLLAMSVVLSLDIAVVLCYMAILALFFDAPVTTWETYVGTPIITVGYFVISTSPMLIARKLGYRLLWGHR